MLIRGGWNEQIHLLSKGSYLGSQAERLTCETTPRIAGVVGLCTCTGASGAMWPRSGGRGKNTSCGRTLEP